METDVIQFMDYDITNLSFIRSEEFVTVNIHGVTWFMTPYN